MQHADFCKDTPDRDYEWRVTSWSAAVRAVFGSRGLFAFFAAIAHLLLPTIVLAGYSWYSHRPMLLIFVFLTLWGFWTVSPGPTGIGVIGCLLVWGVGFLASVIQGDWVLFVAGCLPGVTWFGGCAILGVTAMHIVDALRSSEKMFQMLVDRGLLIATPKTKQEDATARP